jgi:hypothetical protein
MQFKDCNGNAVEEGNIVYLSLGLGELVTGKIIKLEQGLGNLNPAEVTQAMAHLIIVVQRPVYPNGQILGVGLAKMPDGVSSIVP